MQTKDRILVLESDPVVGRELQSVLNFIGSNPVLVDEAGRWKDAIDDGEQLQAVMLGNCGTGQSLADILKEIHQFDEHLPVYLLCDKGKEDLDKWARRVGLEVVELDVDADPALLEEFGARVPVVRTAAGLVIAEGRWSSVKLGAALTSYRLSAARRRDFGDRASN